MQSSLMPRVDIVSNEGAPGGTDSGWFTPSPLQFHSKLVITESLEHVILSDSRNGWFTLDPVSASGCLVVVYY
ncbi:hypothetical protein E2C01_003738 [Portunus trituberculatus]|uniref:Uncharacterized protein n=1 Tax=Portunus trituberculatus TaxID=210409 RepID=A0A5B7CPG0_PORTR|nr:hypothetical protein [Portunus trituberculatus]